MARSKQPELEFILVNPNNEEQTEKMLIDLLINTSAKKIEEMLLKEGLFTQTERGSIDCGVS